MRTASTLTRGAAPLDFHTILSTGEERGDTVHGKTKRKREKIKLNKKSGGGEREEM